MADQLIEGMRMLWTHREEIARSSAAIRRAAEAGILKEFGGKTDVALAGIAVERDAIFPNRLPFFELEFVAPDESLRMGRVSQCLPRHTDIAQGLSPGLMAEDRLARRQELLAKGADGEIDDLALAVARIAPDGVAAVLKSLSTEQQTRVVIPMRDGPLYASLFWCDGVIKVDVGHAGRLYVYANTVELPEARLPDTVAAALVGKRLDAVAELPFCCPSPIAEVRQSNVNGLQLKLDVGRWLVNTRGGTVWQHAA